MVDQPMIFARMEIVKPYADELVECISNLLNISIKEKYYPLQSEVLLSLSCFACSLNAAFARYYSKFIPGLKNILNSVKSDTIKN